MTTLNSKLLTNWVIVALLTSAARAESPKENWPSFRGVGARGVADGHALPTKWNVAKSENIRWKRAVPGLAHSSPIIWGDRLYVTTAVSKKRNPELRVGLYGDPWAAQDMSQQRWLLVCLDKRSGKVLWQREAHKAKPKVARHTKATHCNSTPATDGRRIVTFFGSEGLFCLSAEDGSLVWRKDLGRLAGGPMEFTEMQWGFASSPIIHDGRVYVQCDTHDEQFLGCFDLADGREIWRTKRREVPTWSTPAVYENGSRLCLAVNGYRHIGGYDAKTGRSIWRMAGGGDVPVPTPIVADGLIYITNAHGGAAPLYAIKTDARGLLKAEGESASESIVWSTQRNGAYMQTPLLYGENLYSCSDRGIVKCYGADSGELNFQERLGEGSSGFTASPVAGDGKVYFVSEEGDVFVLQAGDKHEVLAVNPLDEICMASPAISEGVMYFRTRGHVVAVAE